MLSMTGYGRGHSVCGEREATVELKAVNHRFLDLSLHLPKTVSFLEGDIRTALQNGGLIRGHVEVSVQYEFSAGEQSAAHVDEQKLNAFAESLRGVRKLRAFRSMSAAEALQLSGALTILQTEDDPDAVKAVVLEALNAAMEVLREMRAREGEHLRHDLLLNLKNLAELRSAIAERAPQLPAEYREKLSERMRQWLSDGLDPQRIAQEVAIMADKCAIDEELSRLEGHLLQFERIAGGEGETGRKLDFLIQEMNREMNTMGSKAGDAAIIQNVVDGKCVIEKLREQIQNAV